MNDQKVIDLKECTASCSNMWCRDGDNWSVLNATKKKRPFRTEETRSSVIRKITPRDKEYPVWTSTYPLDIKCMTQGVQKSTDNQIFI